MLKTEYLKMEGVMKYTSRTSLKRTFDKNLKEKPETFKLLCGVTTDQFGLLMDCVKHYLSLLENGELRVPKFIDKETQHMPVLTVCRHALHYDIMAFFLGISKTSMQRISNNWIMV